ncbi:iron chaperone [Sphingosinicella sp. CPCC 101087]|uniref:iron chaperone n=1 Tax=Sphingosinicella sp. CPCC 101087 TaxID=2497754 RepID=UPI00101BD62C|nr:DUF1801 domain-containing protein [Sphingosinicella sp. CPCC 101087]
MARTEFRSVDDYLAAQPEQAQSILQQVREVIRKALPEAEERIAYQIPSYRQHGTTLIFFAGWKAHYSIYPASSGLVEAFAEALSPYVISKGTIRFPYDAPIPEDLIGRLAAFRAEEVAAVAQAKPSARSRA